MVRLGFYTGTLYDSKVNPVDIKECCLVLNFKEPVLEDEELVVRKSRRIKTTSRPALMKVEKQNLWLKKTVYYGFILYFVQNVKQNGRYILVI